MNQAILVRIAATVLMTYLENPITTYQKPIYIISSSNSQMQDNERLSIHSKSTRYNQFIKGWEFEQEREDEKRGPLKRRVSYSQTRLNKLLSNSNFNRKSHRGIYKKVNYKMGSEVLSFQMEQQRNAQMKVINEDERLKDYYLSFKKLFLILFQASHFMMENMFHLSTSMYTNKQVVVLCLLFEKRKEDWNIPLLHKLMIVARNIIYMASSPSQFERRIDLVARKVTMHNEKRQKIKNVFLNSKVQRIWAQTVEAYYQDEATQTFIQDQFQTAEEKLCFIEIKQFVVKKLSTQAFGNQLKKYCSLQEIDDDMNLDFKFQFLLAQEFSFNNPENLKKEPKVPQKKDIGQKEQSACSVM